MTLSIVLKQVYHLGNSMSIKNLGLLWATIRGATFYVKYLAFELAPFAVAFSKGFVNLTERVMPYFWLAGWPPAGLNGSTAREFSIEHFIIEKNLFQPVFSLF